MYRVAAALLATFAGLTLLLSFKSHSAGPARLALSRPPAVVRGNAATSGPTATPTTPTEPTTPGATSAPPPKATTVTYQGSAYDTPYGTMQVAAVVKDHKLVDVRVVQQTSGGRSTAIDHAALPVLHSEALSAQSAQIDIVSGATYTSRGYAESLQSALDKAGL